MVWWGEVHGRHPRSAARAGPLPPVRGPWLPRTSSTHVRWATAENGAGDGIRTHDPLLGKRARLRAPKNAPFRFKIAQFAPAARSRQWVGSGTSFQFGRRLSGLDPEGSMDDEPQLGGGDRSCPSARSRASGPPSSSPPMPIARRRGRSVSRSTSVSTQIPAETGSMRCR